MKKLFLALLIGMMLLLGTIKAQEGQSPEIQIQNPLKATTFEELVLSIANFIYWIALVLFPLMMFVAALYFITAGEDQKKIETAKKIIFWTIVGFIIILLSRGIIEFLKEIFLKK